MPWHIKPPTEAEPGAFAGAACLEYENLIRRQLELLQTELQHLRSPAAADRR